MNWSGLRSTPVASLYLNAQTYPNFQLHCQQSTTRLIFALLYVWYLQQLQVIDTLDEYHFLYNYLSAAEQANLALQIRNIVLAENNMFYIVTASTQPLLWTSLNFSLSNGTSLLATPTVFTTPSLSDVDQISSTV